MIRGRKPKPASLKKLAGNPGKRKLKESEIEEPPQYIGDPPAWLDAEAKREWRRIAPQLIAMGLLTVVDRTALEGYCKAYSRWKQAERAVDRSGLTFKTSTGYRQQLPQITIAQKYMTLMHSFSSEFGFTPSARTRMGIIRPPDPEDPKKQKPDSDQAFLDYANRKKTKKQPQGQAQGHA